MECPVCRESMVVIEYRSIELDYCVGCMGVWFDRGEIELVLQAAGIPVTSDFLAFKTCDSKPREIMRPCPLCGKTMHKMNPPGGSVVLDQCPDEEGIWFDAGELSETIRNITGDDAGAVIQVLREYLGEALADPKK
ncbi:zf-TFIIB domain-containing protein [bacterium]|nr:zf-TFIIB domain-containing protein [candidate division CSSED10-310 bacterium]